MPAFAGLFLIFLALTVHPVRKAFYLGNSDFSNGVKVFRGSTVIDMSMRFCNPVNNKILFNILLNLRKKPGGVNSFKDNLKKFILPPPLKPAMS